MKSKALLPIYILLVVHLCGCEPKEDPVPDPGSPVIDLISQTISTAPGHLFWIRANLSDEVGLTRVNLLKQDWYLDKDINLSDSTRKTYELSYKFLTPLDAEDEGHAITLSVEDVGGNITSVDIPVLFDKDVEAPIFKITSPSEGMNVYGGDNVRLFIEVTDNRGIDTFSVSAPELGMDTLIAFDPVNPRYIYVRDYIVPESIPDGTYFITVMATDSTKNRSEQMISIFVGEVDVGEVYCVGGATWSGWDPPDNPMLMRHDPENEGWYEIVTYSYGTQDQNGIKFVGQRAWGPLNWGLDPDNPEQMINDEGSLKILLEEEGYHKVRFSPDEMAYSTEYVGAETPVRDEMYILGSGIVGMDNAYLDPSGALPMTQDPGNPYMYTATVEFTEIGVDDWGACFIFIGNKGDVSEFNLGFWYYPREVLDPDWLDYYGYVVGDLSLNLDPLTTEQVENISDFPPSDGIWNGVPYVAYYLQPGTYAIKLDYHIRHASITRIAE